jgi:hypothetical protein
VSRRVWFARDTGFTADPRIQVLGDEYGPGGPLVIEELLALAKLAGRDGAIDVPFATVARRSFVTPALVKKIVADAGSSGLLEAVDANGKGLSARFCNWSHWHPKDPTAAERKSRERSRSGHADVTENVTLRSVTPGDGAA